MKVFTFLTVASALFPNSDFKKLSDNGKISTLCFLFHNMKHTMNHLGVLNQTESTVIMNTTEIVHLNDTTITFNTTDKGSFTTVFQRVY